MDFTAYPLRIGTVTAATASDDALTLTIDLGGESRTAIAHITESYGPDDVIGQSVVVVLDPPGAASGEVVVLAAVSATDGAVLIRPDGSVPPGTAVV